MQIIAGSARSINLEVPPGLGVRPTAGRAREALFNSLGDLRGLAVADLFAGSGALGLEAASRGAARIAFVERDRRHLAALERNMAKVAKAGAAGEFQVVSGDVTSGAFQRIRFAPDLIFADPPYAESAVIYHKLAGPLREWAPAARLVWELPDYPGAAGDFLHSGGTVRRFGGSDFLIRSGETA